MPQACITSVGILTSAIPSNACSADGSCFRGLFTEQAVSRVGRDCWVTAPDTVGEGSPYPWKGEAVAELHQKHR